MYLSEFDIGNRALQHIGQPRMLSPTEDSRSNTEVSSVYDHLRLAELQRNSWVFAIRRVYLRPIDEDTFLLDPKLWEATSVYAPGSIVKDDNGILWQSMVANNLNNDPVTTTAWDRYFGPMTVHKYDSSTAYYAGELVWAEAGNPGGFVIFVSLKNGNEDDPEVADAWDATVTYSAGETVSYGGYHWRSLIEVNLGATPAIGPLDWDANNTYAIGQTVTASDGYIYTAAASSQGVDPTTDTLGGYWTNTTVPNAWARVPQIFASATSWQPVFAGMTNIVFGYPLGLGPSPRNTGLRVFRKPAGFLKTVPLAPKQGSLPWLGASANMPYNDHVVEGDYILSRDLFMMLRFVADVTDVRKFAPMFCEGLAARIAVEVCEPLTQSNSKQSTIIGKYQKFMTEARQVNAIEAGPVEAAEDEFLSVRR